jgi:hypothetical protein
MQSGAASLAPNRRLQSWKEIAAFFDSDERTVRRWEKERGLPIHRVPGGTGAKVFAYTEELTQWLERPKTDAGPAGSTVSIDSEPQQAGEQQAPERPRNFLSILNRPIARILLLGVLCVLAVMLLAWRFFPGTTKGPQRPTMHAIAVLPLTNLTGDPRQDYLAAGMTDELITELARIGSIRVVSRTSVQKYAKITKSLPVIANELNVDASWRVRSAAATAR